MPAPESTLLQSWNHNAQAWIEAIRTGAIESRLNVTNQAIVLAVLGRQPERVLDLGCGEGWLLRELEKRGIDAVGVDGDATLVEAARAAGTSQVHRATYEELVQARVDIGRDYDLICANFALLHQDIIPLLSAMNALLAPGGALVIQTLHPGPWPPATIRTAGGKRLSPVSKGRGNPCRGTSAPCPAGSMRWTWPAFAWPACRSRSTRKVQCHSRCYWWPNSGSELPPDIPAQ